MFEMDLKYNQYHNLADIFYHLYVIIIIAVDQSDFSPGILFEHFNSCCIVQQVQKWFCAKEVTVKCLMVC